LGSAALADAMTINAAMNPNLYLFILCSPLMAK
jgi:hypothetical protein